MILVTGGTGFVGAALLPELAARHPVAVLTRRPAHLPAGIDARVGDLLDPFSLAAALRGVSTVIHLAAVLPGHDVDGEVLRAINVGGTRNLAVAATTTGVRRVIHMSSAGIYGDRLDSLPVHEQTAPMPRTAYERSKLEAEIALADALRGSSVSSVIVRPTGIHGPGRKATVDFYREIGRRVLWVHGPSQVLLQPTYVADLVRAILAMVDRPFASGTIFNVAGDEALTYPALIDRVARRLGVRARQVRLPAQPTRAIARFGATIARSFGRDVALFTRLREPFVNRTVDISRARETLGFEPVPLEVGIDATIAWARREGRL